MLLEVLELCLNLTTLLFLYIFTLTIELTLLWLQKFAFFFHLEDEYFWHSRIHL